MDLIKAKNIIETLEIDKLKECLEYLKQNGTIEFIQLLEQVKTKVPGSELQLLEEIDNTINIIKKMHNLENNDVTLDDLSNVQNEKLNNNTNSSENSINNSNNNDTNKENKSENNEKKENLDNEEIPKNEYLEKVKQIWIKGKESAIKNAAIIKLKSQINALKNDKLVQLKHLGELVYSTFSEKPTNVLIIDETIKSILEIENKIEKKKLEEKEFESSKPEGNFFNTVKFLIAKAASYVKIKLEISILTSNRESKLSAFGQIVYDKLNECESLFLNNKQIYEIIEKIRLLDKEREEKEKELLEISNEKE